MYQINMFPIKEKFIESFGIHYSKIAELENWKESYDLVQFFHLANRETEI